MVIVRAEKVLRRIERTAERTYLPIIGPERGRVLVDLIRSIKPKQILEVGTFIGYSIILMGKELGSDGEIVTIEIDEDSAKIAKENIRKAEIKPRVKVLVGNALCIIPGLRGKFDMVFLDAAKSEYLKYLRLTEDKLHTGSVVVADNVGAYAHLMRNYLDYVRNSVKYDSQFIPENGDGVEVSVRRINH